jgi:hypothetical protein
MVALWGLIQSGNIEVRDLQRRWTWIRRPSIDFLAGRRNRDSPTLDSRDKPAVEERMTSACVRSDNRKAAREGNREAFGSDGVLEFMSDRAAARVAGCLAGRCRCKPCGHDRTADSHAATYR